MLLVLDDDVIIGKGSCWDLPRVFKPGQVSMCLSCKLNHISYKTSLCLGVGVGATLWWQHTVITAP